MDIQIGKRFAVFVGDLEWDALCELADEMNSTLPDYEVRVVHLDTSNHLEFVKREAAKEEDYND